MLQLQYIKEHTEEIIERLKIKNVENVEERIAEIIRLDADRRALQQKADAVKAEQNAIAKEIGMLFKQGKRDEAEAKKARTADLVVVAEFGTKPNLPEGALPHWDLCAKYNIVDFELGNKITGAGFPVYKGKGARLQRALIDFFLDQATAAGYVEIMPPLMVNEASGLGTGQLPDKEGQMYAIPLDGFYMIPTAEVPITNLYRNVIVSPDQFPIRHVGYSECFRREAGSYGKDVRGLNRLHEFSKVEIVVIEHPDRSYDTLEDMKRHVGGLLDQLGLPYHILKLCGGDISFTSAMTFDFEVWSAAQQKWLEVSSVSNCASRTPTARPNWPTPSTAVPSPCHASWPPCWRTTRHPTASSCPNVCAPTSASTKSTKPRHQWFAIPHAGIPPVWGFCFLSRHTFGYI